MKLRRRKVSGKKSVGRYSRKKFWETLREASTRYWVVLVILGLGPIVCASGIITVHHGFARGVLVGIASVSGPFMCIIFLLLFSGASSSYLGNFGEVSTAEVLWKFEKSGWFLVNGLLLNPKWDIDHVLVGPAGVILIETKWSADSWPIAVPGKTFMKKRIDDAVKQARSNKYDLLKEFNSILFHVDVLPICVLWSLKNPSNLSWTQQGEVTVIPGHKLEAWFKEQTNVKLTSEKVKQIWSALEAKVISQR